LAGFVAQFKKFKKKYEGHEKLVSILAKNFSKIGTLSSKK
jgi:hypothetical protein